MSNPYKGQGPVGTAMQRHRLYSNSHKAIQRRQKEAKALFKVFNPHRIKALSPILQASLAKRALKKYQRINDSDRNIETEVWHTLIGGSGLKPIRHQIMSRQKARKLNYANKQLGIDLYWMIGRQKLSEEIVDRKTGQ